MEAPSGPRADCASRLRPGLRTLLFGGLTDVIFALDFVPAISALTDEPLIVFTSNVFAILGLRAMYFMLAGAMDKFSTLKHAPANLVDLDNP